MNRREKTRSTRPTLQHETVRTVRHDLRLVLDESTLRDMEVDDDVYIHLAGATDVRLKLTHRQVHYLLLGNEQKARDLDEGVPGGSFD